MHSEELFKSLKIDCEKCFGLCCVALYFSKSEGFPNNKVAGTPCTNLKSNFGCSVHKELRKIGLKGCTAYDCFGAGQKVAQATYKGESWIQSPDIANEMFDVFLVMRQLHEMLWYLSEAFLLEEASSIKEDINLMIIETKKITNFSAQNLLKLDIINHREKVNDLLRKASELVNKKVISKDNKKVILSKDFIGKNLRKTNLVGADLKGALLIASDLRGNDLSKANLIGADMRDANISGTNLENCVFLTQSQINTAKGDNSTKLPKKLVRPVYWK